MIPKYFFSKTTLFTTKNVKVTSLGSIEITETQSMEIVLSVRFFKIQLFTLQQVQC